MIELMNISKQMNTGTSSCYCYSEFELLNCLGNSVTYVKEFTHI